MMSNTQTPAPSNPAPAARPNEQGTVTVQGFLRIQDPNTGRIILETRA
jgi:hypothetical protein